MKIIVEVRCGCVTAVYSDVEGLSVDVLDYDNYNDMDCSSEDQRYYKCLEEESKVLKMIY